MGKDLYESVRTVRRRINQASEVTGIDLPALMFEGTIEQLSNSEVAQIVLYSLSTSLAEYLIGKGIKPWAVIGHSLGEYSSLVTAGCLSWEEGLKVVIWRSRAMRQASLKRLGAMGAIIGLDVRVVEEICKEVSGITGWVNVANYNCDKQTVVSGDVPAVEEVLSRARSAGSIADRIQVDGACHSPLMAEAEKELIPVLSQAPITPPDCKLFSSITGDEVINIQEYSTYLKRQITRPVYWAQALATCMEQGAELFVEVGPGRILSSLVRGDYRMAKVTPVGSDTLLRRFAEENTPVVGETNHAVK